MLSAVAYSVKAKFWEHINLEDQSKQRRKVAKRREKREEKTQMPSGYKQKCSKAETEN